MPFGKNLKKSQAAGYVIQMGPDGGILELETRMCSHCGIHWIYKPGSGIMRGFCVKCDGYTCGKPMCDPCNPYEKQIDDSEKGIPTPIFPVIHLPDGTTKELLSDGSIRTYNSSK